MKLRFRRPGWVRAVSATALALLAVADNRTHAQGFNAAQHLKKLDGLLRLDVDQRAGGARRVLIRTTAANRDAVRELLAAQGHGVMAELDGGTLTAVVPADALEALAKSSGVTGISADAVVRPDGDLPGGRFGTAATRQTVGRRPSAHDAASRCRPRCCGPPSACRNRGPAAASPWRVIDSGLEMSAEFQGRVKAFYDFTDGKTEATAAYDDYGHGTHVAGTIAGSGALSANRSYRGLAPDVRLVVLKVLDGTGAGFTSDVVRAIDFAVANKTRFGIDVINLSLGHPIYEPAASDPLVQAVERASRAGIIVSRRRATTA